MGRRSDIDWEKIEREYIAGQLTIRQIAEENGVAHQSITKKAKREGWLRNLDGAIKERTKAKIAQIDIAHIIEQSANENAHKSARAVRDAIEQASDIASGTILRHRADIRLDLERAQSISALLDDKLSQADCLGDVVKAAQAFKALVDSRAKLIDKEREAYGVDNATKSDDPLSDLLKSIGTRSAIPVVKHGG